MTTRGPRKTPARPVATPDRRPIIGAKKKTTFAKMSREAKLREKRHAKAIRTEQRRREAAENGGTVSYEVEDLSHLDVAHVEGVLPDVTVKP